MIAGASDYMHEVLNAPQMGFLQDKNENVQALHSAKRYADYVLNQIGEAHEQAGMDEMLRLYKLLEEKIAEAELS
jgi:hypothetical protein